MSQQTQTKHVSNALTAYRAYRQQDPAERRIGTYLDILDSLFPPLSSNHGADDLLLVTLLMYDPNALGCEHTQAQANSTLDAHHHLDTQEFHDGLQPHTMPPQAVPHVAPGHLRQANFTHAASDMNHVPAIMQQSRVTGHPYTLSNNPTIYYDSSYAYHNMYTGVVGEQKPAPQILKFEPAAAATPLPPTTGPQAAGDSRPRPRPRPRPMPTSSSALELAPTHVPMTTPYRPAMAAATTAKGKGRALSTTPCPSVKATGPALGPTGSFVGHGLMNPVWFNHGPSGPSGLRFKRSPTPDYSIHPLNFFSTKSEPEPAHQHNQYHAYSLPTSALKAFKSSGRLSSPIDLCSSSDKADEDNSDVEVLVPANLSDVYEEWEGDDEIYGGEELDDGEVPDELEGVEEAHQRAASERAASTARSSSPPDIDDLREMMMKGGKPVMEPEELREFLLAGRRNKLWFLVEKGLIITHIYHPDVPDDRHRKALQPINPRRPGKMWTTMSEDLFLNARVPSAIAQQSNKILLVYKDIKHMIETREFCVDFTLSKERAVRAIEAALVEARADGAPLTTITTAPEVYYWIDQGWYEMLDARIGNHPNFRVVPHRSGRVSPRPGTSSGASKKGKEKRAREDNPLSPQPRDVVRPRPNDKPDLTPMHGSLAQLVDTPRVTRSLTQVTGAGPSTAARYPSVPLADNPFDVESGTKPHNPTTKSSASGTTGLANVLLNTCASAREFKDQIVEMRKAQLEIDAKNVDNKYKLGRDEQAGMEEERLHRIALEEARAEREVAEMEERVNRAREGQLFSEMMQTLSHPENIEPDILGMVNQHLRQRFSHGLASQQPFSVSCNSARPSLQNLYARRAALVSSPGPSSLTVATTNLPGYMPMDSSHTNQAPVNYPTAPTTNPSDFALPDCSTLGPSDRLPSLQAPAISAPASTSRLDDVSPGPVPAPTTTISSSSTTPAIPPPTCAPTASSPPTVPVTIPHISVTSRTPATTPTAPPGLSNGNFLPDHSSGNTVSGSSTATRLHLRRVTMPAISRTANDPAAVDGAFPQASPSQSRVISVPTLFSTGLQLDPSTSNRLITAHRDHASGVNHSDMGHSGLVHSDMVHSAHSAHLVHSAHSVHSVHSDSSSCINVGSRTASQEPRSTDHMPLDSHEMSPPLTNLCTSITSLGTQTWGPKLRYQNWDSSRNLRLFLSMITFIYSELTS